MLINSHNKFKLLGTRSQYKTEFFKQDALSPSSFQEFMAQFSDNFQDPCTNLGLFRTIENQLLNFRIQASANPV